MKKHNSQMMAKKAEATCEEINSGLVTTTEGIGGLCTIS